MEKVIKYMTSIGFEVQPCSTPLNRNEYKKRDLLLLVRSISEFIFFFLIKRFPIKYQSERLDKSIWFILRNDDNKTICEVELKPKSVIYSYDNFDYSCWLFRIYTGPTFAFLEGDDIFYLKKDENEIETVENRLGKIPYIKQLIRQKKLESIINGE